jgi:hypothetical protein
MDDLFWKELWENLICFVIGMAGVILFIWAIAGAS